MLRLLFDQDFNHNILRGLLLRLPNLDGVTALQAGLDEAPDPELFRLGGSPASHRRDT